MHEPCGASEGGVARSWRASEPSTDHDRARRRLHPGRPVIARYRSWNPGRATESRPWGRARPTPPATGHRPRPQTRARPGATRRDPTRPAATEPGIGRRPPSQPPATGHPGAASDPAVPAGPGLRPGATRRGRPPAPARPGLRPRPGLRGAPVRSKHFRGTDRAAYHLQHGATTARRPGGHDVHLAGRRRFAGGHAGRP